MDYYDSKRNTINLNDFARYSRTGTISKIVGLKEEENQFWAKLEESNLWYSTDSLELIKEKDLIKIQKSADKNTVEKVKDLKEDLSDIDMDSNACEGGG